MIMRPNAENFTRDKGRSVVVDAYFLHDGKIFIDQPSPADQAGGACIPVLCKVSTSPNSQSSIFSRSAPWAANRDIVFAGKQQL